MNRKNHHTAGEIHRATFSSHLWIMGIGIPYGAASCILLYWGLLEWFWACNFRRIFILISAWLCHFISMHVEYLFSDCLSHLNAISISKLNPLYCKCRYQTQTIFQNCTSKKFLKGCKIYLKLFIIYKI